LANWGAKIGWFAIWNGGNSAQRITTINGWRH